MKKLTALVIAVLLMLFLASTVYADDITVTVTMASFTLRITNTTWAIGTVTPSLDTARQETSYVANDGGVNMDVTLLATDATDWSLASAVAPDTFAMRAIFAHPETAVGVIEDSLLLDDSLDTGAGEGNNTRFYSTNCGSGADAGGLDIAAGDSVSLYLWFQAPTSSAAGGEQTITVTVGGKVAD